MSFIQDVFQIDHDDLLDKLVSENKTISKIIKLKHAIT